MWIWTKNTLWRFDEVVGLNLEKKSTKKDEYRITMLHPILGAQDVEMRKDADGNYKTMTREEAEAVCESLATGDGRVAASFVRIVS